jgi:hypothetical protein
MYYIVVCLWRWVGLLLDLDAKGDRTFRRYIVEPTVAKTVNLSENKEFLVAQSGQVYRCIQ